MLYCMQFPACGDVLDFRAPVEEASLLRQVLLREPKGILISNAGDAAFSGAADPSRFAKTAAREGRHVQESSVAILPEPEKTWFYCSKTQVFENAHVWRNFRQISPSSFLRCFMSAVVCLPAPGSS